jgi:enoyl-CoA hydratase/carnithine racemase
MPMIDVHAAAGAFGNKRELAQHPRPPLCGGKGFRRFLSSRTTRPRSCTTSLSTRPQTWRAQRYLLTGKPLDAEAAHRIGLVREVVATDALMERALAIATRIARVAPLRVRHSLAVSRVAIDDARTAVEEMARRRREVIASEDAAEGLQALLEKREAVYTGR